MSAPSLAAQIQGLGSVSADNLNTYVLNTDYATQLRAFTGLTGIKIMVGGNAALADGGAGIFYWNASSTSADNGTTIIAPTGTSTGRWVRIGYLSAAPSAGYAYMSQVKQELALVDLAVPPAVANNIPASPYNNVNIIWNAGTFMIPGDSLYNFIATKLSYNAAQMLAFYAACLVLPVNPTT